MPIVEAAEGCVVAANTVYVPPSGADVQTVLRSLAPVERRVAREDGGMQYLMRMQPYRTPDSEVDGAVITFVNVTSIVQAEEHQRLLVDELHRVKNSPQPISGGSTF